MPAWAPCKRAWLTVTRARRVTWAFPGRHLLAQSKATEVAVLLGEKFPLSSDYPSYCVSWCA